MELEKFVEESCMKIPNILYFSIGHIHSGRKTRLILSLINSATVLVLMNTMILVFLRFHEVISTDAIFRTTDKSRIYQVECTYLTPDNLEYYLQYCHFLSKEKGKYPIGEYYGCDFLLDDDPSRFYSGLQIDNLILKEMKFHDETGSLMTLKKNQNDVTDVAVGADVPLKTGDTFSCKGKSYHVKYRLEAGQKWPREGIFKDSAILKLDSMILMPVQDISSDNQMMSLRAINNSVLFFSADSTSGISEREAFLKDADSQNIYLNLTSYKNAKKNYFHENLQGMEVTVFLLILMLLLTSITSFLIPTILWLKEQRELGILHCCGFSENDIAKIIHCEDLAEWFFSILISAGLIPLLTARGLLMSPSDAYVWGSLALSSLINLLLWQISSCLTNRKIRHIDIIHLLNRDS